jgi:hypothetical protein
MVGPAGALTANLHEPSAQPIRACYRKLVKQ